MRVDKVQPDPSKPESIVDQLSKVIQVVDGLVEFGDPIDPFDPGNTGRAGASSTAHPGSISNIHGSWVEVVITTAGTPQIVECHHNLYLEENNAGTYTLPTSGEPNVRWLVFGWLHDGSGGDATSTLDCFVTFIGDTVAVNSVKLVFDVVKGGTNVTVDGDHPVLCTLFFTRASRM